MTQNIRTQLTKKEIVQYLLSLLFIINIFISEISNYRPYSFYLKASSSILLFLLCWIDTKYSINENRLEIKNNKQFIIGILLFVFIPILSLSYSTNLDFGIKKIGYMLISVIPTILVFYYFILSANNKRIKIFKKSLVSIALLFGLLSLIFSPYNPTISYSFNISRWSHVIAGRFLSSITVIVLFLHFFHLSEGKFYIITTTIILLVSTYFVGMRAAFLGILILISVLIIWAIIRKNKNALSSLSISLLFSIVVIIAGSQTNNMSTNRYSTLQTNENGKFDDGAINARLIAWKKSWDVIRKNPVLGVGFGGFFNEKTIGEISVIKYPHNLLIEIQLELGIIGSVFFGILFGLIFWRAYKYSIPLFVFLLFSFWLAMFSKDIATQSQLWIGLALIGQRKT